MSTRGDNVDDRAVGGDGPRRRTRFVALASATAVLAAALLAAAAAPAFAGAANPGQSNSAETERVSAASTATPAPGELVGPPSSGRPGTPTPPPASTGRPPVAPTIADPGDVTSSTARFHGTGTPAHVVRVAGPASTGSTGCSAQVQANGSWSCLGTVRSGPQQVFTVRDVTAPSQPPASAPASDVIVPPTIASDHPTSGALSGTGFPGSTVVLSVSGSSTQQTAPVGPDGRWVTSLALRSDATVTVTASQTASTARGYRSDLRSASSAPVRITVDRTAPAAPRITAPDDGDRVGSRATVVRGTGEPGADVTVYVDRAPVCRAEVTANGSWSCSTAGSQLRAGGHDLTATQHDAAGNYSRSSAAVQVTVWSTSGTPNGTPGIPSTPGTGGDAPTNGTGSTGTGTTTAPGDGQTPGDTGTPAGTGNAGGSENGTGDDGPGSAAAPGDGTEPTGTSIPGAAGSGGGHTDWSGPAGDWTAATAYDRTVPTIQAAFSWRTVLIATAVAAGFLLLIAAPLALVAAAARGRIRSPFAGLLGRNRPRSDRSGSDDVLPTWVSITVAVAVAALCTLLGVGVSLEARYVRLAIAVLLGTAVLTAAVVLVTRWAAGPDHRAVGFRVSPWLVLAALVACGITRAADLSPALIVGVVLVPSGRPDLDTAALRLGSGIAAGARSATWRTVALLGLATAGWVLHSLTAGGGFWSALTSEFAITLCVGGVGAVVATLLPFAGSAGSAVLTASRGRYVALAVVAVALTAAVYSGPSGTHASPVLLGAVGAACVAGAIGAWFWARTARPDAAA
ncbi:Ig-like domain-containing protein [Curtobacterium sp. MCJR17_020]|uniref:Ig-like domain-containing protein n=1 Tax=Curtobacterium sp. MCJR17_020 TaxID=2175619 RepID=UPI0011B40C98|nr:Ig-like domain-containing protein [Curtobacterium sp. MCJR17_020]WIE73032.1 Ig-like domain-containing protein [Curtobacterium sp. MCJR17_020]